jgi:hypothetical protein
MFARWGHMNPKRDKDKEKSFGKSGNPMSGFHQPPEKIGIYAYIWPYIEPFLTAWNKSIMVKGKDKEGNDTLKFPPIKKFQHHGDIWCHFIEEAKDLDVGKEYKGSWVKVDTKDLPMLLNKIYAKDIGTLQKYNKNARGEMISNISDPYKRGKGGFMSKDHLEVFIPGKVREAK